MKKIDANLVLIEYEKIIAKLTRENILLKLELEQMKEEQNVNQEVK